MELNRAESCDELVGTVRVIIERLGVTDQGNAMRTYSEGDLRFERTDTGDTEVKVKGKLVLSVPHVVSPRRQPFWEPGDWTEIAQEIKARN